MPDITPQQRRELVKAILALPGIADPARRKSIIDQLNPAILSAVEYASDAQSHFVSIVSTCAAYPGGLAELRVALADRKSVV